VTRSTFPASRSPTPSGASASPGRPNLPMTARPRRDGRPAGAWVSVTKADGTVTPAEDGDHRLGRANHRQPYAYLSRAAILRPWTQYAAASGINRRLHVAGLFSGIRANEFQLTLAGFPQPMGGPPKSEGEKSNYEGAESVESKAVVLQQFLSGSGTPRCRQSVRTMAGWQVLSRRADRSRKQENKSTADDVDHDHVPARAERISCPNPRCRLFWPLPLRRAGSAGWRPKAS
jgi:hypothetical protein